MKPLPASSSSSSSAGGTRSRIRLTVGRKIIVGFLCVLALLLAVGGLNYDGLARITRQIDGYTRAVALVDATSAIDRAFLELRLQVREFVQLSDDDHAKLLDQSAAQVIQQLDATLSTVGGAAGGAPARRDVLGAMRADA